MKLSRKFLNDYIDLGAITSLDIANKMVLVGNEYESITKLSNATGVIVGHVLECVKHPESTKLSICKVDTGDAIKQILCGAPNVSTGQKVIVAQIGAILGDIEIKEAKLAGMVSEGMICSLLELGIESKYLTEEDKNGIHVLSDDAIVGSNPVINLNLDDEVIDFELTSNRGDLLSVIGMAYEVGAIYDKKVNLPETNVVMTDSNINDTYKLNVEINEVPLYLAKLVQNVTIGDSLEHIKSRLIASGIRPINNVVDISNYVMLEYGQPLHFFDADKLGTNLGVRFATTGESLTTLDGTNRILSTEDIVITSDNKPVALAGVMGGLDTEVDLNTKNILIESAIFNPLNIRNTSKRILRSEASNRFEKGIDPNVSIVALNRASYLLNQVAGGKVLSGILTHDTINKDSREITVSLEEVNRVLGMDLVSEEILKIFSKLGFKASFNNDFKVIVSTRRLDVTIKEDLIEEVGRIHGYDNLIGKLPLVNIKRGAYSKKQTLVNEINHIMTSLSLNQVITYSLGRDSDATKYATQAFDKVSVLSPISEDKKVMRQSLITGLYNVYDYNKARNTKNILIYEVGNVYYNNNNYIENTHVAGLLYGEYLSNNWQKQKVKVDFYLVKGMMETYLII